MDNEPNLDSLFEDAVKLDTPAEEKPDEQPEEKPAEEKPETPADNGQKEEQNQAERARQAMARRLREAEERGAKAERERANAIIAELDLDDPDNEGSKVSDLDKAAEFLARRRKKRFASGQPTEADIQHAIQEAVAKQQQPPVPQNRISDTEKAAMDRELAQIARMDPAMTDINAILTSDIGPAFRKFVADGEDFVTSFYKAKELQVHTKEQAAAAEKAKATSKGHLTATNQRGAGALSVPAAEMAIFRELNPGASEAEIQKFYNADRKRYGPK